MAVVDPSGPTPIVAGAAIFMAGALCWGIYSQSEAGDRAFRCVTATFYATAAGALMLIPFSLAERAGATQ